jgi:excinuclease UvrABC helicase subunit UvrB
LALLYNCGNRRDVHQRQALDKILTGCKGAVMDLQGIGGCGKTSTLADIIINVA